MIRDTSAQDKLIQVKPNPRKKLLWIGGAVVKLRRLVEPPDVGPLSVAGGDGLADELGVLVL